MEKFLENLLLIDSPSGYTSKATKFIAEQFSKLGYEVTFSKKGNVHLFIDNNCDKTVGLTAHTDTLGFVVRSINSDGTLNLSAIGGPIVSTVNGEYCNIYTRDNKVYSGTILNKASAAHVYKDAADKVLIENLIVRLDEDVKCKDDAEKLGILNGDFVCYDPKVQIKNGFIKSRFLDDKAGVAIIFQLLNLIKNKSLKLNCNLQIIISTYEEVGHGGSYLPRELDELIAIDMGCVGDDLNGNEFSVSIGVKDSSGPYDYDLTSKLISIAKTNEIAYAADVYPMYGSDVSSSLRAGNDFKAGLVGPGVHSSHGMERTHLSALNNTVALLEKYLSC